MRDVCCLLIAASVLCFLPSTATEAQLFYPSVEYGAGDYPFSVAIDDLDGDGRHDLAVANRDNNMVSILLGNGNEEG